MGLHGVGRTLQCILYRFSGAGAGALVSFFTKQHYRIILNPAFSTPSLQPPSSSSLLLPPPPQELLFQGQGGMDEAGQPLYRASMPHLCRLGQLRELCMK